MPDLQPVNRHWSPNLVLSLVTGTFLLGLIGVRAVSEGLTQLGLASEEYFRGERLPILQTDPEPSSRKNSNEI
ncbi:MAG: hypothetical protein F6K42_19420 [Leptolyngbya sp. SIO1D8]|nr:hypothetical protein [Leptolyngbya sp. SIO1D8]